MQERDERVVQYPRYFLIKHHIIIPLDLYLVKMIVLGVTDFDNFDHMHVERNIPMRFRYAHRNKFESQ